jgi:hypothetical protein
MTQLTATQQAWVDTHPQQTDLYLSIYEPQIALQCRTSGTYSTANQTIGYTSISTGSSANITDYLFQVALIGTSEGADDKGRTWVRTATASTLRFVESDHINWANGDYVTVLKYGEIIPVFPRIIKNPANDEDVIFYKVWDIAYTNQNTILGTNICMGSHWAGFTDEPVYYTASGSVNVAGSAITGYAWTFEGTATGSSTVHTPGYISYPTAGHYRTLLTTTAANGGVDTSVRYISIYDRPGHGSKTPYKSFEITNWSGSRDSYGYSCRVKLFEAIDRTKIKDGALIVIFGEDYYDTTKTSFGGNGLNRSTIKLVGYVNQETIQYDYDAGYVEFDVLSPTGIMQLTECFSVSVEDKLAPTTWYELLNMDCERALYHYYRWHSTVLLNCDFEFKVSDDRSIQYFDTDRESLFAAGNTLMEGTLKGSMVSDSQGKIWCERDVSVVNAASTALPTALNITKKDWIDQPTIERRYYDETSFIEMGGICFDAATMGSAAVLCGAPGLAPSYHGKVDRIQGLALLTQAELNTIAGNLFAFKNSDYPSVEYKFRSSYWNLDIAPQEKLLVTMLANESPFNIAWTNKAFAIRSVDRSYIEKTIIPRVGVVEITQGYAGTTIIIPDIPPTENTDGGTYKNNPAVTPTVTPAVTPSILIYDEHVYLGSVTALDFISSMIDAQMTGTIADIHVYLPVYHNDKFVGNAQALNFLDNGYTSTGTS